MKKLTATRFYALVFGAFLGLCIWKFGNPAILDHKIEAPKTLAELWESAWPIHWANWLLLVLVLVGAMLLVQRPRRAVLPKRFWWLPLIWLGWQFASATQTVDAGLTVVTLWQFCGCVACYFLGALVIGGAGHNARRPDQMRLDMVKGFPASGLSLLFVGIMAAFVVCQVHAVNQRLYAFPQSYKMLSEGQRCGWTNFPPASIVEMKRENIIVNTNRRDVANPVIIEKFRKGRVAGTLVYPNALAGLMLLLFPASLALALAWTEKMRPAIQCTFVGLLAFLGVTTFYWTGSKLGWLIGIGLAGLFLFRLNWSKQIKIWAVAIVLILGLGIFTMRFHHYFSTGATSAGARFDYWRAAVQTTMMKPMLGSGPGTFQRSYEQLKAPESEMARLTHNDFLEQFSDSGIIGGLAYLAWIVSSLWFIGRTTPMSGSVQTFSIFAGLLAWFTHSFGEFGLYIPASAWVAFTLLGCISGRKAIEFDKNQGSN